MDQYKNQKIKMQYIYSSIISDMNIDFWDGNIAPDKIIDIENGIKNYASWVKGLFVSYKKVKSMERCLVSFPDQKVYFLYKDFLTQEWIWLTECIASFSRDLDTWMTRHHSELVQLKDSVHAQARTTDIAEWKAALGLTEERISKLSEEIPIRVKS